MLKLPVEITGWNYRLMAHKVVKLATLVEGDPKAPFSIAATPRCRGGRYSFPWIAPLYPWSVPYNVEYKQEGIKYHLSLWYDSTWDWTQVSRAIGEHSNHPTDVR